MLDRTSDLLERCTLDSHVGDEIGHVAHLAALDLTGRFLPIPELDLFLGRIPGPTVHGQHAIVRRECSLRIESLKLLQSRVGLDLAPWIGDYQYRVTIEVRTRQPFGHPAVDTNGVNS